MADTVTTQTIADTSGVKFVAKLTNFSDGTGDIKILTDANVDKFSLMLECHKETGFSNG